MDFSMFMAGRIHFGPGVSAKAGDLVKAAGAKSVLIVTDQTMEKIGLLERISDNVRKSGLQVSVFSDVEPEPSVETTDAAAAMARESKVEAVIGLGGGSCMDVAKAVSILVKNEGSASRYQGLGLVKNPGVFKLMIPTTAGTGSEVTFTAVLIRKSDGVKGGINSDFLYPDM
ncbi:MAG TPA: iron-containing alcohol dehydrogenase, partial [Synergistales bacterium]|nr:iron-containing alcohol dehydrogenase [Synergistales bacterium]